MTKVWIECDCEGCNTKVERERSEVNRSNRLGRKKFCSLSCAGKVNSKHLAGKYDDNLKRGSGRRKDKYSPFRDHLRKIRRRKHEHNVSLQDLKEQWERQNGRCVYTGVDLLFVEDTDNPNYKASVDRIDSSKGYVKGNIQFVSETANMAKQRMTDKQMLEFLSIIRKEF